MMLCISLASCTTTETKEQKQSVVPISRTKTEPNLKDASELNTQLAIGYIQRQQYKPAKDKLLKSIEQNPDNLVAYKTLAYLYALLGLPGRIGSLNDAFELVVKRLTLTPAMS